MDEKETVEGNKLMAVFMGYEYIPSSVPVDYNKTSGWIKRKKPRNICEQLIEMNSGIPPLCRHLGRTHYELKFNLSWDWLMPVVEKIETKAGSPYRGVEIIQWKCLVLEPLSNTIQFAHGGNSKIESVWKAVVEFIKWYNKQQNK